jgi:hypothetical protein
MNFIEFLNGLLLLFFFSGLDIIKFVLLSLIHGIKSLSECLEERMHRPSHLLVEVSDLRVDFLHFLLGF